MAALHLAKPVPIDDASLVRALVDGSPAAASALWDRYATFTRGLLRRFMGPDSELEDLLQEVFLRLFRDLRTMRDGQALRAFIMQVVTHTALSELRKRSVRRWLRFLPHDEVPEVAVPVQAEAPERLAVLSLYRILDAMSARLRVVFVLYYVEGLELKEVATASGMSLATVKRRLAEAREKVELRAADDPALQEFLGARS